MLRFKARSAEPFEGPEPLRFAPEALKANLALVDLVRERAKRKAATPAKVALAWLPAKKPWIVPISAPRSFNAWTRTSERSLWRSRPKK